MITARDFKHGEFREMVTQVILKVLARLPERQRNIFIWNHYCGYPLRQIAETLRCNPADVEATIDTVNSALYQETRALLSGGPQVDVGTDPFYSASLEGAGGCCLFGSSTQSNWVSHAHA